MNDSMQKKHKKRFNELRDMKRKLDEECLKETAKCTHKNKNGFLDAKFINREKLLLECCMCGSQFSLKEYKATEIQAAVDVIVDAINQTKCGVEIFDERDEQLLDLLGDLYFYTVGLPELYTRILTSVKNNKNHGNKNRNDYEDSGRVGNRFNTGIGNRRR